MLLKGLFFAFCLSIFCVLRGKLQSDSFQKTIYCLDFSGSMSGDGNRQLVEAMSQILITENAEKIFFRHQKMK